MRHPRSLRWRLQAWHALILLLVVAGFGGVLVFETRKAKLDEIDAELMAGARVLEGVLRTAPRNQGPRFDDDRPPPPRRRPPPPGPWFGGPPPDRRPPPRDFPPDGPPFPRDFKPDGRPRPLGPGGGGPETEGFRRALTLPASIRGRYEAEGQTPYFVIRGDDGRVIHASADAGDVPADPIVGPGELAHARGRGTIRELTLMAPGATRITVGRPIGRELAGLRRLAWQIGLMGLAVLGSGLVGGWWLSGYAVRPIVRMGETVAGITATSLSGRVDVAEVDTELGRLAGLLNVMLDRLESAFDRQARFTADASHELRTPLTVILTRIELALLRPRTAGEYREALETCGRAARRMKRLVDGLLTLARADSGKAPTPIQTVALAPLVTETVSLLRPLAEQREIRLETDLKPVSVHEADPNGLSQIVTNLLGNAILYNRPGGSVTLTLDAEADDAVLTVSDSGVGIPDADLPFIFDRFYRVDKARARDSGGTGLGLSIVKSAVDAQGGTIDVSSRLDVGTTFVVRLPRNEGGKNSPFATELS